MNLRMMEIDASNAALLSNFLYEAIFVPSGMQPPSRDILADPQLQVYVQDFGKQTGDFGLFAEVEGVIAGAVWARIMEDYGYIDNETPSLAIALYKEYRGKGVGTALLQAMLKLLQEHGYEQVSLAVQKENYAVKLYTACGFRVYRGKRGGIHHGKITAAKYSVHVTGRRSMRIRKAVQQDLAQLQEMYEAIIAHMYAQQICIWDDVYPCICFPTDIRQERLYVLQEDTQLLAAFALCEQSEGAQQVIWQLAGQKALYLERLGVQVNAMGKGIGSVAVNAAMQCAKARQADALRLFVVEDNTPAIRLYEKNGFIRARGIYHEIIDDALTLQEVGYEKALFR